MKKIFWSMALGALVAWAGMAAAALLNFYKLQGGVKFDGTNNTYTWIFDLDNDPLLSNWNRSGYDPDGNLVNLTANDAGVKEIDTQYVH